MISRRALVLLLPSALLLLLLLLLTTTASGYRHRGDASPPPRLGPSSTRDRARVRRRDYDHDHDCDRGRRTALSRIIAGAAATPIVATTTALLRPDRCSASSEVVVVPDVGRPPPSLLEARCLGGEDPPSYGMEAPDVYYPASFLGTWRASSRTIGVEAPCGYDLFGGGRAGYDSVYESEVAGGGSSLEYRARFVSSSRHRGGGGAEDDDDAVVVADREYNAREIARAAMGAYSVVDTTIATPNRYSCLLAPPGNDTGDLISVDILAIGRRVEPSSSSSSSSMRPEGGKFVCAEFVRQIVSRARNNGGGRDNPNSIALVTSTLSVKEIETISLYDMGGGGDSDKITCRQRTATYLVPSQTDTIAFKRWQLSRGRPVDVRRYDVTYTRVG